VSATPESFPSEPLGPPPSTVANSDPERKTSRFGGLFRDHRLYESATAKAAYRVLRRRASRVGLDVVARTFYSPIPDLDSLPIDTFARVSELSGIAWDLDAQLDFVRKRLAPAIREFGPFDEAPTGTPTYTPNASYTVADAAVLYSIVRALQPRRIVELGSGHSTLVMAQAARQNASDGRPVNLEVFDPYPGVAQPTLAGVSRMERLVAQDVPLSTFEKLEGGDVLFVDTTHTVKIGSDVNFIILEVLPRLAPGVLVHFHDIFLPYEYPRTWLEDYGLYWAEQYLVQAFLAFNSGYEIVAAVHALQRERLTAMRPLLPDGAGDLLGGAFWIRRL
jgi:predicted O-methyltransferase YrrM